MAELTVASTALLESVVFDGVTYNVADRIVALDGTVVSEGGVAITVGDTEAVDKWLRAVYSIKEFDPFCGVKYADGVLTICHIGACTLTSYTTKDGAAASVTTATTRCCTIANNYRYEYSFLGNLNQVSWDGTDKVVAPVVNYAYVDGDANANNATATALQTKVEECLGATELNLPSPTVVVTPENILGRFTISVSTSSDKPVSFNGFASTLCETKEDFMC